MSDEQRDEVARILDHISTQSHDEMNLDAALDAIAETVLPDTITRYFEAHITFMPDSVEMYRDKMSYAEFAEAMSELGWRASKFEHDDVDGIAGKWFVSARDASYAKLESEVRGMVHGLSASGTVERYKIEETLLDSKCRDTL